ncbi:hypothetical protein AC1031_017193 [Aphanomyces cochlioides]|nr:hypothetical protein AC1031_017193 [Aphanomyces cochlioides]
MAGYGALIQRLGESPLEAGSVLEKVEDVHEKVSLSQKDRSAIVEEAVETTMRCADLLDKALRLAHTFNNQSNPDDETEHEYGQAVQELILMDKQVDSFAKQVAASGVFADASRTSRTLLSDADAATSTTAKDDSAFRELYMEEFTTVFGDELDRFRQDDAFEEKDVSFLISCIQTGADVYSSMEKTLFTQANTNS